MKGRVYELPRYTFAGLATCGPTIRVGIFAGIHGDDLEGILALILFAQMLTAKPDLGAGYHLSLYLICNPTGYEDGTRRSRTGVDLNGQFWKSSRAPEVQLSQAELAGRAFHGIISLHTNDTKACFFGAVSDQSLGHEIMEPVFQAVTAFSAHYRPPIFNGFHPRKGAVRNGAGILSGPPLNRRRPFEVILEAPETCAAWLIISLNTILKEYRKIHLSKTPTPTTTQSKL